jgi:predicted nucleic acid-binding protein
MKLFLDTNIFLDLLLQREGAEQAETLLNAIEIGLHDGIVLDITLVNIDYVAKRQNVDAKLFLSLIIKHFKVVGMNNALSLEALEIESSDFEDALQFVAAKSEGCEAIISNDKRFYSHNIPVVTSSDFKG